MLTLASQEPGGVEASENTKPLCYLPWICGSLMAASFGFSVGDFIAVGQLIHKVVVELKEVCLALPWLVTI
jgi:hypothetical protein